MADSLSHEDIERIAAALAIRLGAPSGPISGGGALISREEAAGMALAAARTAVNENQLKTWAQIGFNLADQKDVERLHKTMSFMDALRVGSSSIAAAVTKAVAVAIVLGILAWIALGARTSLGHAAPAPLVK